MAKLKVTVGRVSILADLLDTPTAAAVAEAVPFEARANVWGSEVYFPAPVTAELEPGARDVVDPGELAFRAEGGMIVIGWGPTPASEGEEIRLAAPANVFATTADDVAKLQPTEAGELVKVELAE
jgi:hypothetical protein